MLDLMVNSKQATHYSTYMFYLDVLIIFLAIYFMVLMVTALYVVLKDSAIEFKKEMDSAKERITHDLVIRAHQKRL
jgi:hypothetical protein